jgi:CRP-like cAMP-binding protein
MSNPLIRKLEHGAVLSDVERAALEALTLNRRSVSARHDIAVYDNTDRVYLVMSGIAGRYKTLLQGGRRIVSFAVSGDLCRMHVSGSAARDLRLGALTLCSVVDIPRAKLTDLTETHVGIARAMRWLTLMELSRAREWLVNDSRPAEKRLAHHFCELLVCLQPWALQQRTVSSWGSRRRIWRTRWASRRSTSTVSYRRYGPQG